MSGPKESSHTRQVFFVCGLAVFNYLAFYSVGILLARVLLPADYGDYCAAVALANILAILATLGLEKFSLKVIPGYLERGQFNLVKGFLRFSLALVVVVSTALALATFEGYEILARARDAARHPGSWLILFLPIIAVTRYGIEVLTAFKASLRSMLIYRGLLPLAALVLVALASFHFGHGLTSSHAVVIFGLAWTVSLLALVPTVRWRVPDPVLEAEVSIRPREWITGAFGFLASVLVLTTLSNGVLLVLELFHSDDDAVGVFGAVVQTASFVMLVATSTNRLFLPRLSALVSTGRASEVQALLRERVRSIGPMLVLFLLAIILFGEQILDMFRHHTHDITYHDRIGPYAQRGYWAMVVVVTSKTITTWLATAPYHMMYLGRSRQVLAVFGAAAAVALVSAVPLSRQWNELGAACAYAVPMTAAFLCMHRIVRRNPAHRNTNTGGARHESQPPSSLPRR